MIKVLLCDDSNVILTVMKKRMTDIGYQVVGLGKDGNEGFSLFKEKQPDLVILDVTMPNKDGRECLKDIMSTNPLAKVIMVSALTDKNIASECLKLGAKDFISKNSIFNEDEFKNLITPKIHSIVKVA